jgi:hypothetical protein
VSGRAFRGTGNTVVGRWVVVGVVGLRTRSVVGRDQTDMWVRSVPKSGVLSDSLVAEEDMTEQCVDVVVIVADLDQSQA